jgi:uncharacterized cupin superfamily protein
MPRAQEDRARLRYRAAHEGIPAPADYPDAPISIVLDRRTPGADLFGVAVAIGADVPLHVHSMMELQFVVAGTGLALDADGGETAIAPGGTVLSPAGPGGAHGFRNTGPLPLTLLCVYPSPGGATPDRAGFELGLPPPVGPRSVYVPPAGVRLLPEVATGVTTAGIIDERVAGAELHAVLMSISAELPMHHHAVNELQFVVAGSGVVIDADGIPTAIAPGGVVSCPAGPGGAHAVRNTGPLPLQLLCVYPSPGGAAPLRLSSSAPDRPAA